MTCFRLFSPLLWGIPPGCEWWRARLCPLSLTRCLGIQAEWSPGSDLPPSSRSCWDSPRPAVGSPVSDKYRHLQHNTNTVQMLVGLSVSCLYVLCAHMWSVQLYSLLLADDVLQVLDGFGDARINVDQVMRADGGLVPQHPLIEWQT